MEHDQVEMRMPPLNKKQEIEFIERWRALMLVSPPKLGVLSDDGVFVPVGEAVEVMERAHQMILAPATLANAEHVEAGSPAVSVRNRRT